MNSNSYDFLMIGNSTAAVGAIEAIRALDKGATIAVVAAETEHTYSRPLITYYVSDKVAEENIYYRPTDFYDRLNVERILGRHLASVSPDRNTVTLDDGATIGYRNLLLAAGGAPIAPPLPGIDRPGVFFMNTIEDARRAKGWLAHARRAVVIGGGLTGLKTAEALAQLGQEVTVVELANRVLTQGFDETASDLVRQALVENGIDVLTEVQVSSIDASEDSNDVAAASLSTGERIACETVFVTIGVRPRIEIVKDSGIATGRGILVDRHMRTNISNVYAAGDIAQAYDPLSGENRVLPILPNAYIGGRVAGLSMLGRDAEYNLGMSVNSVSFFGRPFMSAGLSAQPDGDGYRVISKLEGGNYRRFVIRDGALVGMIITQDVERAGILTGMMRAGAKVDGMEQDLLNSTPRLMALPRELVEERIHSRGRNWL